MNVIVDGLMTSYQKTGKGKVVVCLHGWGDSAKTFNSIVSSIADHYAIYALDLPGFGGTQVPPSAWGLSNYSEFVSNWEIKLGIKEVFAYIGHSNGGSIAIQGLTAGNLAADKLVLLASAGVRDRARARKGLLKAAAKVGKAATSPLPSATKKRLRQKFYGALGSDMTLLPHMEETFRKTVSEDIQAKAREIKMPTLLIYGDQDTSTPVSYGKLLAAGISHSQLEVLTGAGHFLHQEQPDVVGAKVLKFLDEK